MLPRSGLPTVPAKVRAWYKRHSVGPDSIIARTDPHFRFDHWSDLCFGGSVWRKAAIWPMRLRPGSVFETPLRPCRSSRDHWSSRSTTIALYWTLRNTRRKRTRSNLFGRPGSGRSSTRAIPELFARCPRGQTEPRIDQALFSEAYELFAFTRTYEQVAFSFELADRGDSKSV